ncbi:hypothetical protein HB364_13740 [Pseudoflavitalea sp. X16]|uniref:RteC domain-containing protein n=1 Tax=Paraflavitalea devenefica TaxID=2716334 RepID=UPI0014209C96|nr:RteC domain-containing protein [Paraflavitalea devenefica]NII26150.1 hypothetical protein [Paraflavitalea devenefica]
MEQLPPQSILASLDQELDKYSFAPPGDLQGLSACIDIVCNHLHELFKWARQHTFPDTEAEIHYFKHQQPGVESKLFFYSQALLLEQYLPTRGMDEKLDYYRQAYRKIDRALTEMAEFYRYFQLGATHLDAVYFVRPAGTRPPTCSDFLLSDPALRAPRSLDQARIMGYKALESYLDTRIWLLQQPTGSRPGPAPLRWQASRSALTELIYALLEVKAFGSDAPDVKRVSDYFQQVFHIQISNIYATYEDNRLRKKNRVPFLDSLKTALERRMDQDDLHAL